MEYGTNILYQVPDICLKLTCNLPDMCQPKCCITTSFDVHNRKRYRDRLMNYRVL